MSRINVFDLFAKITLDTSGYEDGLKDAGNKMSAFGNKLKKGFATAAKVGGAAITTASTGVAALTKASIDNYAEYEQLVGGAELMFGKAFDAVMKNSQDAYKTVQMSQNEYLQQVNGFATGLKTALGGNEQAAADLAHKIIQAEADVVAATGNSQEAVQNAFNGIMRSNFTMLDNLQIGITPTKEGFQEVIDKVNEWNKANGEATDYQMGNLADMQAALVDYIDMVGMSGYAQNEAAGTIQGSLASMKSAWQNLLTGIADGNQDLSGLISNLVDSVASVGKNLMPKVKEALNGIVQLITELAPIITAEIPAIVSEVLPSVLDGAASIVQAVVNIIPDLIGTLSDVIAEQAPNLIQAGLDILLFLIQGFTKNFDTVAEAALTIIRELANWIYEYSSELTDAAVELLLTIVEALTDTNNISVLLEAATTLVKALVQGMIRAIPKIAAAIPTIVENISTNLINAIPVLIDGAVTFWTAIIDAIPILIDKLLPELPKIIETVVNGVVSGVDALADGAIQLFMAIITAIPVIIESLIQNLPNIIETIVNAVTNAAPRLLEAAIKLFSSIIEAIPTTVTNLIANLPKIIVTIAKSLVEATPKIFEAAIKMFGSLFTAIGNTVAEIPEHIAKIWNGIKEAITGWMPKMLDIGKNLIKGLWDGISSMASWLWDRIKDFFNGIVDGIKWLLGIHSPSTVFADVGKNMALGIGKGWEDEFNNIKRGINADMNFGTANIDFVASGISKSNRILVNGMMTNASFADSRDIVINLTSEMDGTVLARKMFRYNRNEEFLQGNPA